MSYKQQVFPLCFITSDSSNIFMLHLKAQEYFNHYNIMKSPILIL